MVEKRIKLTVFNTGYATHLERVVLNNGRFSKIDFPSPAFLLEHPQEGFILYDTGYSSHFEDKQSKKLPYCLYNIAAPFTYDEKNSLKSQLKNKGILTNDINHIIISHFHADHISGLQDFPNAKFHCLNEGYNNIKNKKGLIALFSAFFPHFLPINFENKLEIVNKKLVTKLPNDFQPFYYGYDIFGDKSIYGIKLPGHGQGQMGLIFYDDTKGPIFLISDTCWISKSYREFTLPSKITKIVNRDWDEYKLILNKVHNLWRNNSDIIIVPSHCKTTIESLIKNE